MNKFACPYCGMANTKILRKYRTVTEYRRQRSCHDCGQNFATYEVADRDWRLLAGFKKLLKNHHDRR